MLEDILPFQRDGTDFFQESGQVGYSCKSSIRKSGEIGRVIKQGFCYQDNLLRIHVLPEDRLKPSRAAIVVPRFGRTVVKRNRLKRRLQELLRSNTDLACGYLLVVRIFPESYEADFRELESHFKSVASKIA